jgi:hypothetical protein
MFAKYIFPARFEVEHFMSLRTHAKATGRNSILRQREVVEDVPTRFPLL